MWCIISKSVFETQNCILGSSCWNEELLHHQCSTIRTRSLSADTFHTSQTVLFDRLIRPHRLLTISVSDPTFQTHEPDSRWCRSWNGNISWREGKKVQEEEKDKEERGDQRGQEWEKTGQEKSEEGEGEVKLAGKWYCWATHKHRTWSAGKMEAILPVSVSLVVIKTNQIHPSWLSVTF